MTIQNLQNAFTISVNEIPIERYQTADSDVYYTRRLHVFEPKNSASRGRSLIDALKKLTDEERQNFSADRLDYDIFYENGQLSRDTSNFIE